MMKMIGEQSAFCGSDLGRDNLVVACKHAPTSFR